MVRCRVPMGVLLLDVSSCSFSGEQAAYLKTGSLPKKATKVKKEIMRTPMATLRTAPMLTSEALRQWAIEAGSTLRGIHGTKAPPKSA